MVESAVPISSDSFRIDFRYDCVQEFVYKFLEIYASDTLKRKFEINLLDERGQQLIRLCLAPEESEFLEAAFGDPPEVLLIESGEIVLKTLTVIETRYRLFAVLAEEGNQISAFIGHENDDHWTQIRDTIVQEISDWEDRRLTKILLVYLPFEDLDWTVTERRQLPMSADILEDEIALKLILPGDVAERISCGFLIPSIESFKTIGIDSNSTFSQVYKRVVDWLQIGDRVLRLWRFGDDNKVIDRLPISDELVVVEELTLLVTFGYPDEVESDFFVYIAIFEPLYLHPPLQLLYTFGTTPEISFMAIVQNFLERVLELENFSMNVFVARGIQEIERVPDLGISLQDFNVSCGTVIILEPLPGDEIQHCVFPDYPYGHPEDYLNSFYYIPDNSVTSCERYFAIRRTYVSLAISFHSGIHILTFPAELIFSQFMNFCSCVLCGTIKNSLDTMLFYVPGSTQPFTRPLDAPIGAIFSGLERLDMITLPRIPFLDLGNVMRLEIQIEESEKSFAEIFPAGISIESLLTQAQRREWIKNKKLCVVVQLSPDGQLVEQIVPNGWMVRMLHNPNRIARL
jgi:hypothetical protein